MPLSNCFFSVKRIIVFFYFILVGVIYSEAKTIKVLNNETLISGHQYRIKTTIDLKGAVIVIPSNCTLKFFSKGCLVNGKLIGNDTKVDIKDKRVHFKQSIFLEGTWCANKAIPEWFDATPDCVLSKNGSYISGTNNYQPLQNLLRFNNVFITQGCYFVKGHLFIIDSNKRIEGQGSTIKGQFRSKYEAILTVGVSTPVDFDSYVHDVVINNLSLVGVKNDSTEITYWGHGLRVQNAQNVHLTNIVADHCKGDGFNICETADSVKITVPENVVMSKCSASNNLRCGLSITGGKNISVDNSIFEMTGGGEPQVGVDIESNYYSIKGSSNAVCSECNEIEFNGCLFANNTRAGINIESPSVSSLGNSFPVQKISIRGSVFVDDAISLWRCKDVIIADCNINTSSSGVVFQDAEQKDIALRGLRIVNEQKNVSEGNGIFLCIGHKKDNLRFKDISIIGAFNYGFFIPSDTGVSPSIDNVSFSDIRISNCWHNFFVGNTAKNVKYDRIESTGHGHKTDGMAYEGWTWSWDVNKSDDIKTRKEKLK